MLFRSPGEARLHCLELGGALTQFLLTVEELEGPLLDELHAPLNIPLRLIRLRADLGWLGFRLCQEGLLPVQVLFPGFQIFLAVRELSLPLVNLRFSISDPFLAVQEFDRPPLQELPLADELGLVPLDGRSEERRVGKECRL